MAPNPSSLIAESLSMKPLGRNTSNTCRTSRKMVWAVSICIAHLLCHHHLLAADDNSRVAFSQQVMTSTDANLPLRQRVITAKSILSQLEADFDEGKCRYVVARWNNGLWEGERKELLQPMKHDIVQLVRTRMPNAEARLQFELLGLCALFADTEPSMSEITLSLVKDRAAEHDKVGEFCRIRRIVVLSRAANQESLSEIQEILRGKSGPKQQAIALWSAYQTPIEGMNGIAEQILGDMTTSITVKLLALLCLKHSGRSYARDIELLVKGIRDDEEMFYLHPFTISEDPWTPRQLALIMILNSFDDFSKQEITKLKDVAAAIPSRDLHSMEAAYTRMLIQIENNKGEQ